LKQVLRYVERQAGKWHMIQQAEVDVSLVTPEYIIEGKIDLIKGEGDTVELVDFKSEQKHNRIKDKDRIEHYHRQLQFYAYLVEERTRQKVSKMILYYTGEEESNPIISFPYIQTAIDETVKAFDDTVQKIIRKEFTAKAIEGMKNVKAGCPLDPATEMGSLISPKAAEEVEKQVEHTVKQGAKLVLGGKRYNKTYFEPTVLTGVTKDMDIARDMEVFGPVMPIIKFDSFDEAIEIANNSMYGLNAGVITKDSRVAIKAASLLENGVVVINGSGNYRNIDQPHGGVKMSGVGKEGLCCTIQDMTDVKSYVLKNILAEK